QEKFVDNPFGEGKLYVTGDLTRCLKDGNLEFIGRIDNQVKMRGFRIELGEIESALTKQQGIVDSIVTVHKDRENNQRLVAYVVVEPGVFDAEVVRNNLVASMPSYMVPSIFSPLEQFPLTSNGKIDRKRLPEPDFKNLATVEYVAPRSQTEQKLAVIWAELLGAEKIGIHHNFFNLGGHSLLAMRMVAQIREHWKIDFPIKSVFEAQELHALADLIDQAASSNSQPIERVPRGEPLPLSYAQQRLWIVNAIESDSAQYNMPAAIDFDGELNVIALESALNAFVGRHEIVRTVYVERDGLPYQYIRESVDFELKKIDLSHFDSVEQSKTLDTYTKQEALAPFDLANDLMLRATLIILSDKRYTLLATMHHIASDGWSTGILVKELAELYSAFVENRKTDLPELSCQYADYAAWQRKTLAGEKLQALLSYWRGQLAQLPSVHNLPLDRPRLAQPSHAGGVITQHISADIVTGLQRVAKESNATFFMTFHAAFAGILHRYSGETDIVLGTPVANRDMVELEPQVGLFVNTLVVRSDFSNDLTFLELLEQGKATLLNAYEHQELPFDMVVNELQVERSQSFNPLFQVMLAFQSSGENRLQLARLDSVEIRETVSSTKFDLTLNVVESENGLKLTWEYAKDLFDESTIRRLSSHFKNLLAEIVNAPNTSLRSLPLLDEEERRCLIESWNDTDKNYPRKQTLHQLFEAQVARTPDHAALVYEDKALTYAELNAKANQLAHYLRAQGVGPDVLVGVCTERSIEMVVALYGILKAGGGYVPFDPAYPKERLVFMLEDSKPSVMLTQQHLLDSLPTSDITTFCLDTQWSLVESQPTSNPKNHTDEANLAYVIFTSGSTGRPKGVGIEHAGIVNRLQWMQEEYQLTAADRVLQKTPFSFDVSVWEFFWPLLEGATLVVAKPGGHQDVNYLTGLIA
ncbi:MAG: condensation domain-containing protein, partial [Burkholderiaceae bacterium]